MKTACLLLFAFFALTACAEARWQKGDGSAGDAALDLSACRKLAQSRVNRMYGPLAPPGGLQPRFGNDASQPTPADRQMIEGQAVGTCMRERGYRLSP